METKSPEGLSTTNPELTTTPSTELLTPQEALEKTDPKSLDKLFETDPEELTDGDVGLICERLRAARAQFAKAEAAGKKPKALTPSGQQLTLEDLNL